MNKLLSLLFILISFSSQANTIRVDLFVEKTVFMDPLPGVELVIHDISAPDALHKHYLPKNLSSDPAIAKKEAQQFFSSPRGREYTSKLQSTYAHQTLMMQYGIQKIPAMVFNGEATIYGSIDLVDGLQRYHHYLQEKRQEKSK